MALGAGLPADTLRRGVWIESCGLGATMLLLVAVRQCHVVGSSRWGKLVPVCRMRRVLPAAYALEGQVRTACGLVVLVLPLERDLSPAALVSAQLALMAVSVAVSSLHSLIMARELQAEIESAKREGRQVGHAPSCSMSSSSLARSSTGLGLV